MINGLLKLYLKGHDIIFRLHPSSSEKKFLEYYNEDLNNISFKSKGSIHMNHFIANTIISFHSTSLIYGALYKKIVSLKLCYFHTVLYIEFFFACISFEEPALRLYHMYII